MSTAPAAAIPEPRLVVTRQLDLVFEPRVWRFAQERRAEIDAHFAKLQEQKPQLWNGRVLLLHHHEWRDGRFRGAYLETDFASFLAWRDWGFPDSSMRNCFAAGAVRSSDGAFLLGVMGSHTANSGLVYFPAGTPDPTDVVDGKVDLEGSVRRETMEETGLTETDFAIEPGWHTVFHGARIAQIRVLQAHEPAEPLAKRIRALLARQHEPELADVLFVRGEADLRPQMPPWLIAFLRSQWACR